MNKNANKNSDFSPVVLQIVNDMRKHFYKWKAPTKTNLNRWIEGKQLSVLRNYYSNEAPVQLFINMVEIENLTKRDKEFLSREFGIVRAKREKSAERRKAKLEATKELEIASLW